MIFSSVWSTLMTSSMSRRISLANRSWMSVAGTVAPFTSEDLWPVAVLHVEHAHELQACRPVQVAGIKKDGRQLDLAHELLQQGGRPVHRKQGRGPDKEDDVH